MSDIETETMSNPFDGMIEDADPATEDTTTEPEPDAAVVVASAAPTTIRFVDHDPPRRARKTPVGTRRTWPDRLTELAKVPGKWAIFGPAKSESGVQSARSNAKRAGLTIEARAVLAADMADADVADDLASGKLTAENRSGRYYIYVRVMPAS